MNERERRVRGICVHCHEPVIEGHLWQGDENGRIWHFGCGVKADSPEAKAVASLRPATEGRETR